MEITVPESAARSGTLRVWLRRVPVSSDTVYAFRVGPDGATGQPIVYANVYGRGEQSTASENVMLLFRSTGGEKHQPLRQGEKLRLRTKSVASDRYEDVKLDILRIE